MATVKRVSRNKMIQETGMDTLGYTRPQNNMILIRDDLPKAKEKEVLGHEFDHLKNGEEGPFWGAVAGAVISGIMAQQAASSQASAIKKGSQGAIAEQQRQYDLTREDLAPYRQTGTAALNRIAQMYGLPSTDVVGVDRNISAEQARLDDLIARQTAQASSTPLYVNPDGKAITQKEYDELKSFDPFYTAQGFEKVGGMDYTSQIEESRSALADLQSRRDQIMADAPSAQQGAQNAFQEFGMSPGYQFRVQEGEQGLQNYLGANNMRLSGRALRAMEKYRQGQASQEFGNYMNRMFGLAGIGQGATGTGVSAGQAAAGNIGNIMTQQGGQLASIYGNQAANMNNAFQGGLSNWTTYQQQQNTMSNLRQNPYSAAGNAAGRAG